LAKTLQSKYVTASQPVSLAKPFYLMMGQQQGGAGGGGGGEGGGIKITGKPKLSSLLTLGMFTMPQKPSKKRPRTQQQQQKKK
jgi:GTPase involved in cell partitioning and DNA repair